MSDAMPDDELPKKVWLSFSDNGTYLEDWCAEPFAAECVGVYVLATHDAEVRKRLADSLQDEAEHFILSGRPVFVEVLAYLRGDRIPATPEGVR